MFCVIAWALYASTGGVPDNTTQVQWLISNPWGIVSLVDLYVGFTVFSMWIWFREADADRRRGVDGVHDDDGVVGRMCVRVDTAQETQGGLAGVLHGAQGRKVRRGRLTTDSHVACRVALNDEPKQ